MSDNKHFPGSGFWGQLFYVVRNILSGCCCIAKWMPWKIYPTDIISYVILMRGAVYYTYDDHWPGVVLGRIRLYGLFDQESEPVLPKWERVSWTLPQMTQLEGHTCAVYQKHDSTSFTLSSVWAGHRRSQSSSGHRKRGISPCVPEQNSCTSKWRDCTDDTCKNYISRCK